MVLTFQIGSPARCASVLVGCVTFVQLITEGFCQQCITHLTGGLTPMLIPVTLPILHGEGPHWDAHVQVLYFVDISGRAVHRLNPATNTHTSITLNNTVSFVIPIRGRINQFIIGLGRNLAVLIWDGIGPAYELYVKESVDSDKPTNRFNDAKVDPWGRLWAVKYKVNQPEVNLGFVQFMNFFSEKQGVTNNAKVPIVDNGTMGEERPVGTVKMNQGSLYHWSMMLCKLDKKVSPVSISNGIAWSDNMKYMYYADSPTRRVDVFDFNGGEISNRRIAFDFVINNVPGNPDGITIDRKNNLWIACWGGYRIIQVDPNSSKLLKTIILPVERVTSVTFGGPFLDILYITTMKLGLNETELAKQPLAGSTFAVTNLGSRGTVNNPAVFYCVNLNR